MKELVVPKHFEFKLRAELSRLAPKCFLCKWILKDLDDHGKLTGWPYDYNDKPDFPVESKLLHLQVEPITVDIGQGCVKTVSSDPATQEHQHHAQDVSAAQSHQALQVREDRDASFMGRVLQNSDERGETT